MEEKNSKDNIVEMPKKSRWQRFKGFCKEHAGDMIQAGIAVASLVGGGLSLLTVIIDHKEYRKDEDYRRSICRDPVNGVAYWLDEPMSNDETLDMLENEKHGESRGEYLKRKGKI